MEDRVFDSDKPHKSIQELYEQKKIRLAKFADEAFVKATTEANDQTPALVGVKTEAERIKDSIGSSVSSFWGKITGPKTTAP